MSFATHQRRFLAEENRETGEEGSRIGGLEFPDDVRDPPNLLKRRAAFGSRANLRFRSNSH